VTRPAGRALLVAAPAQRGPTVDLLQALGFACDVADDPYAGMTQLCRAKPGTYRAVVLGLGGMFKEELAIVASVRKRLPQIEVWLAQTDGRSAALAEAMRLGADGLVSDDGLHRIAVTPATPDGAAAGTVTPPRAAEAPAAEPEPTDDPFGDGEFSMGEPVLTADELRALLQEQPSMPPSGD
jgi:DNA-binding NarL/FixJ family response regulator